MKISSGNFEIINSGTVIGVKNEDITINFPNEYSNFKFIFEFIDDKSVEAAATRFDSINNSTLKIKMFNFNSTINTGNTEIIHLGFITNRELYINYRVLGLNDLSYTLIYTFYLKNKID